MAKGKTMATSESPKKMRPAISPEAEENQLIALATNLARQQLMDGTASSQVITHYLKLGSTKERLEKELKMEEIKLQRAKTENLKSIKRSEELMEEALRAFRNYNGQGEPDDN